jgi:DNA end-binding protein Ku
VRTITRDAETEAELSRRDLVRGYEFKKDHFLLLTEADFENVRIESSATLSVDKFVAADSIDPIYFDDSYFMVPDGDAGADVYVVLREAIARAGRIALSRVVIARRERRIAIVPMGAGLVAHTLHEARDLHDPANVFEGIPAATPDAEMVGLATQLIDRQTAAFDPADMEDRYEARLRDLIAAKLEGEGLDAEPVADADRGNVIDLMQALKQSLAGGSPAKAATDDAGSRAGKRPSGAARTKAAKAKAAPEGRSGADPKRGRA